MKLLDFMKTEGRERMGSASEISFEITDELATGTVPAFDITNVYEYVKANLYKDTHVVKLNDILRAIPFCVPPFKEQWVEFDMAPLEMSFGIYVGRFEAGASSGFWQRQVEALSSIYGDGLKTASNNAKWATISHVFAKAWNKPHVNHTATVVRLLDCTGSIMQIESAAGNRTALFLSRDYTIDSLSISFGAGYATLVSCLAFGFLSCKNVAMLERAQPRAVRREAQRMGREASKFYVLEIGPIAKALSQEGQVDKNGPVKALHIVRGHFATYTEERPLFGKVVGRVFREAHVRGSAEAGEVKKDYKINPNK